MEPAAAAGDADGLAADRNALEIAPASRFPQPLGKPVTACGSAAFPTAPTATTTTQRLRRNDLTAQLIGTDQSEHHQQSNLEPRASLTLRPTPVHFQPERVNTLSGIGTSGDN
jgi:hypothetical protein